MVKKNRKTAKQTTIDTKNKIIKIKIYLIHKKMRNRNTPPQTGFNNCHQGKIMPEFIGKPPSKEQLGGKSCLKFAEKQAKLQKIVAKKVQQIKANAPWNKLLNDSAFPGIEQ